MWQLLIFIDLWVKGRWKWFPQVIGSSKYCGNFKKGWPIQDSQLKATESQLSEVSEKVDFNLGVAASKGSNDVFKTVVFCLLFIRAFLCMSSTPLFHNNMTSWHQQFQIYILFSQLEVHQKRSFFFPNHPNRRPRIIHFFDCLLVVPCPSLNWSLPVGMHYSHWRCLFHIGTTGTRGFNSMNIPSGQRYILTEGEIGYQPDSNNSCPLPWCHANKLGKYKMVLFLPSLGHFPFIMNTWLSDWNKECFVWIPSSENPASLWDSASTH